MIACPQRSEEGVEVVANPIRPVQGDADGIVVFSSRSWEAVDITCTSSPPCAAVETDFPNKSVADVLRFCLNVTPLFVTANAPVISERKAL